MVNTSSGACLSFSFMRLIFSWAVLYSGSSNPQLIMLKIPSINIHWVFFYAMHMALSDYLQHIERNEVFTIDFPLTKGLRHIVEIPPLFFFFWKRYFKWPLGCSNVLEQTFVNDGWFHSHLPFCTPLLKLRIPTVGRSWQWCIKVYFILISSHSIQVLLVTIFIPPSRFDSMISSLIFGWLKSTFSPRC